MSEVIGLVDLLLPFFGLIALGFLSGKLGRRAEGGLAWMQFFLVYLSLPCLFFKLIAGLPLEELVNGRFLAMTMLCTGTMFALSFATGFWQSRDVPLAVIQGLAGCYANVGYMGPPLVVAALGLEASAPVALVFTSDIALLFALVPVLMALAGVEKRSLGRTLWAVMREVSTHPFILAILVASLASYVHLHLWTPLETMVSWLAAAAAPCALFLLGVTVALRPVGRVTSEVPVLVAYKLILHPLLVWVVLSLAGAFPPVWVYAAVLMAALPPALTLFVVSSQYDVGVERASTCVLVGTVASLATLAVFLWLIKTGTMPAAAFGPRG